VLEILKHEMAHQYESDVLKTSPGHGASFKQTCQKLGVHPNFIKSNGDITSDMLDLTTTLASDAEKMIKKVEKLLSLATSDNEHEAQQASKKANDLIQKHNLDRLEPCSHDSYDQVTYCVFTHKKKRVESIQKSILAILREFYFVDTVTCTRYDPQDLDSYKSIVLFGTQENLLVAEYVYHYLYRTGKTLWSHNRVKSGYTRRDKVAFDMGFTNGIKTTLEKARSQITVPDKGSKTMTVTFKALATAIRQKNQAEVTRLFPKLKRSSYGSYFRGNAYNDGYQKGKSTLIKKGIHNNKAGATPLLT